MATFMPRLPLTPWPTSHLADAGIDQQVGLVRRQLAVQQVDVADEVSTNRLAPGIRNLLGCTHLEHPALAHHGNAAGHGHGLFLVVVTITHGHYRIR